MGVPMEQAIRVMAKLKAGMFEMQETAPLGITREKLMALGIQFTKTGEVINRQDLWPAAIKLMEKFSGTMEKVSRTTGGKLTNLSDSFFQFQAAVGATVTPALKPMLDALTGILGAVGNLDPALLRLFGTTIVLGAGAAKLAAALQGWIMLQRLNVVATNTSVAATMRQTTAEVAETDVAAARAMGLGPKVIAQLEAEALARNQVAAAAGRQAAAVGAGGIGGGFLGKYGRYAGIAAKVGGGLLMANTAMGALTRGEGQLGQTPERPSAVDTFAPIVGGAAFGPVGAAAGFALSMYNLHSVGKHNEEIVAKGAAESARLTREMGGKIAAAKREEQSAKKAADEAKALADLEKALELEKQRQTILEADTRIAGYRNEKEAATIPFIQKQIEGAKQYEALLAKVSKGIPENEKAEDRRAALAKELLSTTVEREGMERKIRDILKEQADEAAKIRREREAEILAAYSDELDAQDKQTRQALNLKNRDEAAAGPYWRAAMGAARTPEGFEQARAGMLGELGRQTQVVGELNPERLTPNEKQAKLMELYGQALSTSEEKFGFGEKTKDLYKNAGRTFADAFNEGLPRGGANLARAFNGEIMQQVLNGPANLNEMLPSWGRLSKVPRGSRTVMNIQLNVNGGRREILDEFTRILDTEVPYESEAYAFSDA
jgi:hypothetical protein